MVTGGDWWYLAPLWYQRGENLVLTLRILTPPHPTLRDIVTVTQSQFVFMFSHAFRFGQGDEDPLLKQSPYWKSLAKDDEDLLLKQSPY